MGFSLVFLIAFTPNSLLIRARLSGAGVAFSLHIQQIVGSQHCPGAAGRSLSVTITGLPKAMVYGALFMGHCT